MEPNSSSDALRALSRRAPRYTSYPTAPHFTDAVGPQDAARWLAALPDEPVSLYLHIPFCDTLCWFCACRTQGATRHAPVARYLEHLTAEAAHLARLAPGRLRAARMHWGGGSPTVLTPDEIESLAAALRAAFELTDDAEIAVEIDPRDMTPERLDAFARIGLNRASIGVQDFDPVVQKAINRMQGWEMTRDVIEGLRARGVRGVNIDALYGLPFQTESSLRATLERLIALRPDRVALYGYAHVPWMARRQRAIPAEALPGPAERMAQAALAAELLTAAGYEAVGIDHFALPEDGLARAAREGRLRRNFQGYTDDPHPTLIGMGASAISRAPQGYWQNAAATSEYQNRIGAGALAVARGRALSLDDRVRAHAIERIMCDFRFDGAELRARFGDFAEPCLAIARALIAGTGGEPASALAGRLRQTGPESFELPPESRPFARLAAAAFDAYLELGAARHSQVV
ncbi:oxygen-independent coproporphyrinogen III oxidase [Oceanicella actignis]|uniref:oxygen-independent coproporphyrinogen III oxidase n=1 Tax=Oceanicella actignis TaxID=1189325 RepID=UPI0011E7E5F3|nr:oxygen-independent coproporphyrinogen III oxidase [Oceanicella actignis]TYO88193.1 oxygen-independent coproporphyrinogen-3 oxidase [Oceanicella actignis]